MQKNFNVHVGNRNEEGIMACLYQAEMENHSAVSCLSQSCHGSYGCHWMGRCSLQHSMFTISASAIKFGVQEQNKDLADDEKWECPECATARSVFCDHASLQLSVSLVVHQPQTPPVKYKRILPTALAPTGTSSMGPCGIHEIPRAL